MLLEDNKKKLLNKEILNNIDYTIIAI